MHSSSTISWLPSSRRRPASETAAQARCGSARPSRSVAQRRRARPPRSSSPPRSPPAWRLARANSATIVPSRMTRMRSLMPMISGSSLEIIRMARPCLAQAAHQAVDLGLGADVDAAGRLVHDQDPRPGRQPLARARPSAGCRPTACRRPARGRSRGYAKRRMLSSASARLGAAVDERHRAPAARSTASETFSREPHRPDQALAWRDPRARRRCRGACARAGLSDRDRLAVDAGSRRTVGRRDAEDRLRELAAPGADQARRGRRSRRRAL